MAFHKKNNNKVRQKKQIFIPRKKFCRFCVDKAEPIDWKNIKTLKKYLSDSAKLIPSSKTGTCSKHQKNLTVAIKQSRYMAVLPYHVLHIKA